MAYESHGFYHFYLEVFHIKIIVSLLLIYCCLIDFSVFVSLFVEPFGHTKKEMSFLKSLYLIVLPNNTVYLIPSINIFSFL